MQPDETLAGILRDLVHFSEQRDALYLQCHQAARDKDAVNNQHVPRQDSFDPSVFNSLYAAQLSANEHYAVTQRRFFYCEEGLHTTLRQLRERLRSEPAVPPIPALGE